MSWNDVVISSKGTEDPGIEPRPRGTVHNYQEVYQTPPAEISVRVPNESSISPNHTGTPGGGRIISLSLHSNTPPEARVSVVGLACLSCDVSVCEGYLIRFTRQLGNWHLRLGLWLTSDTSSSALTLSVYVSTLQISFCWIWLQRM